MTQTIEQLTARVRELEEENARLKVATNFGKSKDIHRLTEVVLSDCGISTEYRPLLEKVENRLYEFFDEQLVTSQAYAEQLREAHKAVVRKANMLDVLPVAMISHDALALPRDTSVLDAYVAEKVKEIIESHAPEGRNVTNAQHVEMRHKFVEQIATLTRQLVGKWQPISTAPKDAFVLLAGPSGYTTIKTVFTTGRMCSDYHKGRWIDHANDDLTDWGFEPTHWMPLPKAPNGASS